MHHHDSPVSGRNTSRQPRRSTVIGIHTGQRAALRVNMARASDEIALRLRAILVTRGIKNRPMQTVGVIDRAWRVVGVGEGWRRVTRLPRAACVALPLPALVNPLDIPSFREALRSADPVDLRVGVFGAYRRVRVEIGPWAGEWAPIVVESLEPVELTDWWLPAVSFARLPAMPRALEA